MEAEADHAFQDSISQVIVQKLKTTNSQGRYIIAASSWDGKLQIFDVKTDRKEHATNILPSQLSPPIVASGPFTQTQGPILGICFQEVHIEASGVTWGSVGKLENCLSEKPSHIFIAHTDFTIKVWDPCNH